MGSQISKKPYEPFSQHTEFVAYIGEGGSIRRLENIEKGYTLAMRPGGFVPKTGIILCQYLGTLKIKGASVLDIGTGESALLAIHCATLGASIVEAIDIDEVAVEWAEKNLVANNLISKVKLRKKSLYSHQGANKFDLIVSNPPQMPVKENRSIHDDAGRDGKSYLHGLIKLASRHLKPGGLLVFAAFDFLGVDTAYNKQFSLFKILRRNYFSPQIVLRVKREVRHSSYTARNLNYIKKIYPKYVFRKDTSGNCYHDLVIVAAQRRRSKIFDDR